MPTVSVIFMGWIGQLEFNASSLARTLYILFGYSFHFGLTYACDTLLSQAFGKNKREMGIIMQRALLIGVYAVLIEWIFLFNIQYLTKYLDKNDEVVRLTNEYLSFSIIVAPFEAISIIIQKFTINHGVTWPILIINIIGNIVSIIVHYILLFVFHFGVRAPPIAFSCAYLVMILLCILYLRLSSICEQTWHPWTIDCFRKWSMYLKLGIPGVIAYFLQSLVYGGAVLLSTIYGPDAVTAQAVVFNVDFFLFLICLAFAVSSNIVIGRYLGSQQYERAEQAKNAVYTTALIIIFITTTFSFSVWYFIPYLFNTPPSAIKQTRYLLAIVIIFCAVDFYHLSQATILKSCQKQYIDAIVSFSAYLIVGVPSGIFFIFILHLEMAGYWFALVLSLLVTNTIFFICIKRIDWKQQAENAQIQVSDQPNLDDEASILITDKKQQDAGVFDLIKYKLFFFVFLLTLFIYSAVLLKKNL
ncbi:unnamed protein product [Adineta steineri]|uniref:Multidrug and toxin extrusion protein n=2 Tax=Adineta steineri TaxID=433720 RepID=A0A820F3R3_9BILA|nr:unnamed protein product [Adineta steineri]